mmetsp:Transcript_16759/g.32424  ORF Transcript_16759/g.32424 Transcript_16759/m.32424 type:complete len:269 (+) Transcript_16759:1483-2289(+)
MSSRAAISHTSTRWVTLWEAASSMEPMLTRMALSRKSFASLAASWGHVALNMTHCLVAEEGVAPMMARTSFSNPWSSMRSASSSTRYLTLDKSHRLLSIKSISRPGVATTTCAVLSAKIWSRLGMPPNTMAVSTPSTLPASFSTSPICKASSRVGARHAMHGVFSFWGVLAHIISPGAPKASVFPDPVEAMPMRSWLLRMMGQLWLWMGLGVAYLLSKKASRGLMNPACLNWVTGLISLSLSSTVMPMSSLCFCTSFALVAFTSACST